MATLATEVVSRLLSHKQKLDISVMHDDDSVSLDSTSSAVTPVPSERVNLPAYSPQCYSDTLNSKSSEKVCVVCGDRASGYHYNALSCEGCKGNVIIALIFSMYY